LASLRYFVKGLIPHRLYLFAKQREMNRRSARVDRRTLFSSIYANGTWGGQRGEFYSGSGSLERFHTAYREIIGEATAGIASPTIVDLGCGDFRVASAVVPANARYIGVDIVPSMIAHHQANYANERIQFQCLDIVNDALPDGDICLIRQVLQHLSNDEISAVLRNTAHYPALLITEHFAPDNRPTYSPNRDIPHGAGTRVPLDSGVDVRYPPFSLAGVRVVAEVPVEIDDFPVQPGEQLKIFLVPRTEKDALSPSGTGRPANV
jgi:SAM-dependent methyltransferase